jgi:hypothetical protein
MQLTAGTVLRTWSRVRILYASKVRIVAGSEIGIEPITSQHYSRGFVTKPLRRAVRRASAGGKKESILEQYVDRLSGEHARRNSVSGVAVEAFVNNAG